MPTPWLAPLLLIPLGGCVGAAALAGVEVASVTVFGRDVVDIGVSAVTGRDCSIVHLDRRQDYCAPKEHLPGPQLFCTKTLGTAECWADPERFATFPRQLADAPALTLEQQRQVLSRWPKSLNIPQQ